MKKIDKISKVTTFQNKEVEANFKQKEKEVMTLAQRSGKTFGGNNLPEPIGDNLVPYIGDFKTICEELVSYTDEKLQSHSHVPEFNTDKNNVMEEEGKIKEHNSEIENSLKNLKSEIESMDVEDFDKKIKFILIVSTILCLSESAFNTIAFEAVGDNLLFAIALAVPITILILLISHVFGTQVRKIQNPTTKKLTIVGVLLAMIPIFYVLGSLRTIVMEKEGNTGIGIITFIIINYFFFIATAILSYKYWPTKEESLQHEELKKLKAEYKKKEKELKNNHQHMTQLNVGLNSKAIHINHISYSREYYVDKATKLYNKAVSVFIKNNIMHRSDRKIPDCCMEPYPKLNITGNFDYHLTNNKN
ncbi:MAG: hypothetical protein HXX18_09280 [Bacteroidetes bacterium]|nr:hypothetical protein [Bacteroidota bacterium]